MMPLHRKSTVSLDKRAIVKAFLCFGMEVCLYYVSDLHVSQSSNDGKAKSLCSFVMGRAWS